jgi:decaprenylphospho-beta-D-ribofuranose 2-oxidase
MPSTLSGWGGTSVSGDERRSENLEIITRDVPLSRGLGRSYGDSSLPPPDRPIVANTALADRLLAFDESTGELTAESGCSVGDLVRTFLSRGWVTPVTPGTQFVTLGGMVAADVHGKNHQVDGSIGAHVRRLRLRVGTGAIVQCSPSVEPELFWATIGGMGLTGHILEVTIQLKRVPSPWITGFRRRVRDIDEYFAAVKDAGDAWPYRVGWIDCLSSGTNLGRGVLMCGRWATADEAPAAFPAPPRHWSVPFMCPSWVMGPLAVRAFNEVVYRVHRPRSRVAIMKPDRFFYPLDSILHWNRLYGRRGFTQHQSVLPESAGVDVVRQMLQRLTRLGGATFLCVIKDCGDEGHGLLSFPRRGTTIALDLPIRDNTQRIIDELNEFVAAHGGRVYLAKDAFTRPEHFRAMEPRLAEFARVRRRWDPEGRIKSAQSIRLLGDRA